MAGFYTAATQRPYAAASWPTIPAPPPNRSYMHLPEIQVIRQKMINALEEPDAENVLRGDYVCHLDIPEETPIGFDTHFTICGEEESPAYLVVIKRIDL